MNMLEVKIIKVSITQMGFAIVLKAPEYSEILPIFIAPLETAAISNILEGRQSQRPMTHDLGKSIIEALDFTLEKVFIDHYSNGIFYAKLYLKNKNKVRQKIEIDARPSDAISLAIRFKAPIFIDKEIYHEHSVDVEAPRLDFYSDNIFDAGMSSAKNISSDDLFGSDLVDSLLEEFALNEKSREKKENERSSYLDNKLYKDKKQVLQQMLDSAVAKEKYEDAALIRDELKNLLQIGKGEKPQKP